MIYLLAILAIILVTAAHELHREQQAKDFIFRGVVHALREGWDG